MKKNIVYLNNCRDGVSTPIRISRLAEELQWDFEGGTLSGKPGDEEAEREAFAEHVAERDWKPFYDDGADDSLSDEPVYAGYRRIIHGPSRIEGEVFVFNYSHMTVDVFADYDAYLEYVEEMKERDEEYETLPQDGWSKDGRSYLTLIDPRTDQGWPQVEKDSDDKGIFMSEGYIDNDGGYWLMFGH